MAKVTTSESINKPEVENIIPFSGEEKVTIHLIPAEWDNLEFEVFGINGTLYQINTGEDVEVPIALAESIANIKKDRQHAAEIAKKGK